MSLAHKLSSVMLGVTRRELVTGAAALAGLMVSVNASAVEDDGISRSAEAIHQEPVFAVSRERIYSTLTDAKQFDQVVQRSAAMKSMEIANHPCEIDAHAGGAFLLFGGYISGRNIELVANERVVQAWRAKSWEPGAYSIVAFELKEQGSGTKIIFDHKGFPQGQAAHLAAGWKGNYWEPMEKFFKEKM